MYDVIVSMFFKGIEFLYRWLNENLLAHIFTFSKEFGGVIIFISAVIFLLIAVYLIMNRQEDFPFTYMIETLMHIGNRTIIPELRVRFNTSTSGKLTLNSPHYYKDRYKFRVIGLKDKISIIRSLD